MAEVSQFAPGTFCWVDLATTDAQGARKFYTELFGWTAADVPAGEAGTYTMLEKDGKNVCALFAMSEQLQKQGAPAHWQSYVSVQNADESVRRVMELGGTVIAPPFDVMEVGRMAVVADPTGAAFALWQPKQHIGAQIVNQPGALCWNELYTKDLEAASNFYSELFDWTTKSIKGAMGEDYIEFINGDRPAGGMLEIREEWGQVPPNWAVYFAVEDCDATLERALSLGGKVDVEPMEVQGVGRFAILQDPQGAHFAVIQLCQNAV